MTDLQIAVYAIAKNEFEFIDRWTETVKNADYVIVGDTGLNYRARSKFLFSSSIDSTPYINVIPWRFDDARNAVLNQIPDWIDVCVSLDLDEVLPDDWRAQIESVWIPGVTNVGWYNFVWSHDEAGKPLVAFQQHKIHSRYGWRWRSPVHEDLSWYGEGELNRVELDMTIHHWPDDSKSRGSYLPLLRTAVNEDPNNHRMRHYFGRELMYRGEYEEAIEELFRCAKGTSWDVEQAVSFIYISDCYLALDNLEWADNYAEWAVNAKPDLREAWVQRYKVANFQDDIRLALIYSDKALKCLERYPTYMNNSYAWSENFIDDNRNIAAKL